MSGPKNESDILTGLLEKIGSDRAHCECMRRFVVLLIVFCKIDKFTF
jgi:hypothetical protein